MPTMGQIWPYLYPKNPIVVDLDKLEKDDGKRSDDDRDGEGTGGPHSQRDSGGDIGDDPADTS